MEFFKKILSFFKKAKETVATVELNIQKFVQEHKSQIRLMITIFDAIFPAGTGAKKMACLVSNVCDAIGFKEASSDVAILVEKECQKIYDEFKASMN
ncbi:MAG: hypothetical protein K6E29_09450 [Cyanobacteria bacterium RUI128]|nr:hypothetical protein [Cyanobacteria bacterium RUI128]